MTWLGPAWCSKRLASNRLTLCAPRALALLQGWHVARSMLAIAPDVSTLLLPAALRLLLLGGAAGALVGSLSPSPAPARGAWAGALLGAAVSSWVLLALARFDAEGADPYDPANLTDRVQVGRFLRASLPIQCCNSCSLLRQEGSCRGELHL